MAVHPDLVDLSPDVVADLQELAQRVTQGVPAFRSLEIVLSKREWSQVELELEKYFPPAPNQDDKVVPPSPSQNDAAAPPLPNQNNEVVPPPQQRPAYYAIKTLMKLRNISQPRAILELGLALEYLTESKYRRLLRAIGEGEPEKKPPKRPVWNEKDRMLTIDTTVLIKFTSLARPKNQVAILDAFERSKWKSGVTTPLRKGQCTHDAVHALNARQDKINFQVENDGTWITWKKR